MSKNRPFLFGRLLKVIPFCLLLHLHPLYFVSAFQFKINSGVAGAEFQIFNVIFKISPHHNLIHTLQFIYLQFFTFKSSSTITLGGVYCFGNHRLSWTQKGWDNLLLQRLKVVTINCYNA